jgi:hypothetical protein
MRAHELGRPDEERERRPGIETIVRPPAGGREPGGGSVRQSGFGPAELCLVAGGLLEVIADDLVALDERLAVLIEPVGEAGVQVGTDRLGERVVGGVSD